MGSSYCFPVRYERLVTSPEPLLRELMKFLNLTWTDDLLHHDELLQENKLSISKDPIFKNFPKEKISNESIGKWRGNVAEFKDPEFLNQFPMLKILNYND